MAFPFARLPLELQVKILDFVLAGTFATLDRGYYCLKAYKRSYTHGLVKVHKHKLPCKVLCVRDIIFSNNMMFSIFERFFPRHFHYSLYEHEIKYRYRDIIADRKHFIRALRRDGQIIKIVNYDPTALTYFELSRDWLFDEVITDTDY